MAEVALRSDRIPVAVVAALDTKADEASFVCEQLRAQGCAPVLVDVGVLGEAGLRADVDRAGVAAAAGADLSELRGTRDPAVAGEAMGRGLRRVLADLHASSQIAAVIALGGSKGATIACEGLRALPFGFPKVLVSPVVSGQTRRFVGASDIVLVPTVADLLGLNRITRSVLARSARIAAALARDSWAERRVRPTVALSSFGVTTACAERVRRLLSDRGMEVVAFPASGVGGQALEALTLADEFVGVIDLTTSEMADELVGGNCSAGPDRLRGPGRAGIPHVVSLGGLDFVNFGPPETVPATFGGRLFRRHSAAVTLMRTTVEENRRLGAWIADVVNRASGPCAVVVPAGGFSDYDRPGEPFFDPIADGACVEALRAGLKAASLLTVSDAHINDPSFADLIVEVYGRICSDTKRRPSEALGGRRSYGAPDST